MIVCCSAGASGYPHPDEVTADSLHGNLYLKFNLDIRRRNILMMFVPRLYDIYDGSRFYVGESYGSYVCMPKGHDFRYDERLRISTIRNRRNVLPMVFDYVETEFDEETLFNGKILSPFHERNKRFYKYHTYVMNGKRYLSFRPRVRNSVLVSGSAVMGHNSQEIMNVYLHGEHDHMGYDVNVMMDTLKKMPIRCDLRSTFKFLGNDIETRLMLRYGKKADQPTIVSDIADSNDPQLMQLVRVGTLTEREQTAYDSVYRKVETVEGVEDQKGWRHTTDDVGKVMYKYFIRRPSITKGNRELSMTPVLDPFAIGYSKHTGVSYRVNLQAYLSINDNKDLNLSPRIGYNFRQHQLYFNAPLRYTFNRQSDGWLELYVSNGNRISNGILLEKIKNVNRRDTIDWNSLDIDYFRDFQTSLRSNIPLTRHTHLGVGAVFHRRSAVNKSKLIEIGERAMYHSFAPSLTFTYAPSRLVSYKLNYERGIPRILNCDSRYERMEFDSQFTIRYNPLTNLNMRFGAGLYTNMASNDFVDYGMFAENYLPDTWNDDWTGRFFLLSSDLYNASKYYIRSNVSYETPLLLTAYIPFAGYYIEKERMYISTLQLHKTSPYTEMGYAFTTRFFSFGVFAGFFGRRFQEFGTKINVELFNRW